MDVTIKTTGYLIGEYITINLKAKYAKDDTQRKEAEERIILLGEALDKRISAKHIDWHEYGKLYDALYNALYECWHAQETVMDSLDPQEVYSAAKTTLIKNKERNIAIRALDQFFGDEYYSHLEKTYKV